ncbi:MAG: hypothetical protein IPJ51_19640 [Saprospiraceae bacterium]|nr:hypothetical protein [Saprospiraceae bacterium]
MQYQDEQDTLIETVAVNEEQNSLSFMEMLQINLNGMTKTEILAALQLELNFIEEFEPYRQDYLQELELVMEIYSETGNKEILTLIF